jgi:large subunit ribosomal protein L9
MKQQLLLLEDVEALGKKGEVVTAKPGYIRNFLVPQRLAVIASSHTLRKQEKLRAEREAQGLVDRKESEELKMQIDAITLETRVKVDPEGHMYGSVSAGDIATLFQERGLLVRSRPQGYTKLCSN